LAVGIAVAAAAAAATTTALLRPFAGLAILAARGLFALAFVLFRSLVGIGLAIVAFFTIAPAAAATAPATLAPAVAFGALLARLFLVLELVIFLDNDLVLLFDERCEAWDRGRPRSCAGDAHLGAFLLALGQDLDLDAVALLDLGEVVALGVEQVHGGFGRSVERDHRALALCGFVLDQAQRRQSGARRGADQARAIAVRAGARGRLEHAGAQPLAAHLHQPEAGDPSDLDARAV